MVRNNCTNCSNRVGAEFCTMHLDMIKSQFRKCKGHKVVPKKKKQVYTKPKVNWKDRMEEATEENTSKDFFHFLKRGGHWSFNREGENEA